MTFRLTRRAHREAERLDAWWRANREDAPDLFTRELGEALDQAITAPRLGKLYGKAAAPAFDTC